MSKEAINILSAKFKWSAGFYDKFINVCPDQVWGQAFGRFPVWQNVYHALSCVPFFLAPKDAPQSVAALYPMEVLLFKDLSQAPADKNKMTAYAKEINAFADKYFTSVSDADLGKQHEGLSARIGKPNTQLDAITLTIGHHMYHFGMCDAALRGAGLDGLF
ncbi:MAG: hypothetical protein LBD82_08365 [Deltaproteobacteria bacterium]|jgi:hypothetical protein|nr:hypothetical protein [Deltaproteobacteria bacterium]